MFVKKLKQILESIALKGEELAWVRKVYEKAIFQGEQYLDQDEQDRITDLWERVC